MKNVLYVIFFLFIIIIIVPVLILQLYKAPNIIIDRNRTKQINTKAINVYMHEQDAVVSMDLEEYIKGVVAAEMPANFEFEALKAQAVAARTYTLLKVQKPNEQQRQEHKGADICTNYAHCQAWKDKAKLRENWGVFGYIKYWDKISKAVEQTRGMVIVFNGELINPLFHSTSGGKTENSEDVFLTELPYLRSVISLGEESSPRFTGKVTLSFNEFKLKLSQIAQGLILTKKDVASINVLERSEGGRIKKIQIGNKVFDGKEIRNVFSLNSTNFNISSGKSDITIETLGYGHGVGMSQFGANFLAGKGQPFVDILKYYYRGVEVLNSDQLK